MATATATEPTTGTAEGTEGAPLDVERVRAQFPALHQDVHGKPLVYLDNAATSQKPTSVLDALRHHYETDCSNVHRGVHTLSQRATEAYEAARKRTARFVGAAEDAEIIFTKGTTDGINLVASAWGGANLRAGDEILITGMEHHSNIVPWQMIVERTGAVLKHVEIEDDGSLDLTKFEAMLSRKTRLVGAVHVSNALGTVNPVAEMIELAHGVGAVVLIDGAQAVHHVRVDVQALGADFFVFSGHKMYGPTGIGALYGRRELLEAMPPYQGGGDMIRQVTWEGSTWASLPNKYEAGTPNIAGAVGLGAAMDFIDGLGIEAIAAHEAEILRYGTERLLEVPGLRLIGTAPRKASVLSFVMDIAHPLDIGTILDMEGVAVRTGHHCAQPVMRRFDVPATARASLAAYNTKADIDRLVEGLHKVREIFG